MRFAVLGNVFKAFFERFVRELLSVMSSFKSLKCYCFGVYANEELFYSSSADFKYKTIHVSVLFEHFQHNAVITLVNIITKKKM